MKHNQNTKHHVNHYFWRTHAQQEIDYIEEHDGQLHAFEFKWNPKKRVRIPQAFLKAYPENTAKVITPESYIEFTTSW